MSEISLDALTQGRAGVTIWSLTLRRTTVEVVSAERLNNAGLEPLSEGQLGVELPPEPKPGSTYCSVSVAQALGPNEAERDVWELSWDRVPSTAVPEYIQEASVDNLLEKVKAFWAGQAENASIELRVTYALEDYEISLPAFEPVQLGNLRAQPFAVYWSIEGAKYLDAISPLRHGEKPMILASGMFEAVGFPRADDLEALLWEEVATLIKRRST